MAALSKVLAAGCAATLLAVGGPASGQYFPSYGYGYPYPGNVTGSGYGYAPTRQVAINECADAAQTRLGRYGSGRVLGISDARPRADGGFAVRGVATSGRYDYAYGYAAQSPVDLTWRCQMDVGGYIREVSIVPAVPANPGYGYNSGTWDDDFSRFGYRRY